MPDPIFSPAIHREASPVLDAALAEAHRLMEQRRSIAATREQMKRVESQIARTTEGRELAAARERLKDARDEALKHPAVVVAKENLGAARKAVNRTDLGRQRASLKGQLEATQQSYAEGLGVLAENMERGRAVDWRSAQAGDRS
jgi:hypothetical protein